MSEHRSGAEERSSRVMSEHRSAAEGRRITRADLEAKLREVKGEVEETGEAAKTTGLMVAGGAAFVLLVLAFLLGKRRGRRKSTVVEIRRV